MKCRINKYTNILQWNELQVITSKNDNFPEIQICIVITLLSCKNIVQIVRDANPLLVSWSTFFSLHLFLERTFWDVVQIFTCWRAFLSLDSHSDITDGNPKVLIQPGKITHFIHYSTPERRGVIDALSLSLSLQWQIRTILCRVSTCRQWRLC